MRFATKLMAAIVIVLAVLTQTSNAQYHVDLCWEITSNNCRSFASTDWVAFLIIRTDDAPSFARAYSGMSGFDSGIAMAALAPCPWGYSVAARSKLNVMLRRQ